MTSQPNPPELAPSPGVDIVAVAGDRYVAPWPVTAVQCARLGHSWVGVNF